MNQIIIINNPPSIALIKHFPTSSCSFFSFNSFTLDKKEAEKMHVVQLLNYVQLFATPWTLAHQAPLSMGFSRQEY